MIVTRNFAVLEQQPLTGVGTTASGGSFSTAQGQTANSAKITNYGAAGVQIIFAATAPTAVNTASAAGTKQAYVAAGAVEVIEKGSGAIYFSAITDSGTTNLIIEAGEGA